MFGLEMDSQEVLSIKGSVRCVKSCCQVRKDEDCEWTTGLNNLEATDEGDKSSFTCIVKAEGCLERQDHQGIPFQCAGK